MRKRNLWISLITVICLTATLASPVFAVGEGGNQGKTAFISAADKRQPAAKKGAVRKEVKFDTGARGVLKKGSKACIRVKKGSKIGKLPTVKAQKGYKFTGWYTKRKGGQKISANTRAVFAGKTKVYYAHYKKTATVKRAYAADTLSKKYLNTHARPKGAWVYKIKIENKRLIVWGSLDYTTNGSKKIRHLKDGKRIYPLAKNVMLSGFEWAGDLEEQIALFNKLQADLGYGGVTFKTVNGKVTYITFAG